MGGHRPQPSPEDTFHRATERRSAPATAPQVRTSGTGIIRPRVSRSRHSAPAEATDAVHDADDITTMRRVRIENC